MEQKDIDRLLVCRKAIDEHRQRKVDARISTQTTVPMQNVFEASMDIYLKDLGENGFKSVDAFYEFNGEMCMVALKESLELATGCDRCKGYVGEVPCVKVAKETGCELYSAYYEKWENTKEWIDNLYKLILNMWRNADINSDGTYSTRNMQLLVKQTGDFNKGNFSICPDWRGISFKFNGLPPFDLNWK